MKKTLFVLAFVASLIIPQFVSAQNGGTSQTQTVNMSVSSSNLIRIVNMTADPSNGGNVGDITIDLTLSGATEAGAAVSPIAADSSTRLRMSCFTPDQESRKIQASITSGGNFAESHSSLQLALRAPVGSALQNFRNYVGGANTGVGTLITLGDNAGNKQAQTLVSNITTSWSGTGIGDGYEIYYRYAAEEGQSALRVDPIVVTFTIGAN